MILRGVAEREGARQRAQGLVLPPVRVEKTSLIRWLFSWALQDAQEFSRIRKETGLAQAKALQPRGSGWANSVKFTLASDS